MFNFRPIILAVNIRPHRIAIEAILNAQSFFMPTPTPTASRTTIVPSEYAAFNRVRWGAVIAGALLSLVTFFALNLLGIGIGLTTIDPAQESGNALSGLGTGALVWNVVSSLLAVLAGGYAAGKLSGFPKKSNAAMHGLLSWALFTAAGIYMLTTTVGSVFNTVGSALSSVVSGAGSAVAAAVPNNLDAQLYQQWQQADLSLADIRREALQLLEDTDKRALDPDRIEARAQRTADRAQRNAADAAQNPYRASGEINAVLDRIKQRGDRTISAADQEALVNVLAERSEMSEAEARQAVNGWSAKFENAMATVGNKVDNFTDQAATTVGNATDGIGTAAILSFFALLLGAAAGFFGGGLGRQADVTLAGGGPTINSVNT